MSLLRDWEMLSQTVLPRVVEHAGPRGATAWTIGRSADAVAVALLLQSHTPSLRHDPQVFLSGAPEDFGRARYTWREARLLPRTLVSEALAHQDTRWVPQRWVTEKILLSEPPRPVDLLIISDRGGDKTLPRAEAAAALDRLRQGGCLVCSPAEARRLSERTDIAALVSGGSRSVFSKLSPPAMKAPAATREPEGAALTDLPNLATREDQLQLVESNYGLAHSVAKRYGHSHELPDDLTQVAMIALLNAARRFRKDYGTSFSTYATATITGEVKRHFRDTTWMVRISRRTNENCMAFMAAREHLEQTLGTSPTNADIAKHLNISEADADLALAALDNCYRPDSLNATSRADDSLQVDIPTTDIGFEECAIRDLLERACQPLGRKEQMTLRQLCRDSAGDETSSNGGATLQERIPPRLNRILSELRAELHR